MGQESQAFALNAPACTTGGAAASLTGEPMPKPLAPLLLLALVAVSASGCIDVVESTPNAVWVEKPLIAFGTVEGTAEAECARYGKRAVFRGSLEQRTAPSTGSAAAVSGAKLVYVPIYAFDCE
jgi:hypothetical protein